jgi:glucosylceramidase
MFKRKRPILNNSQNKSLLTCLILVLSCSASPTKTTEENSSVSEQVEYWVTTGDKTLLLQKNAIKVKSEIQKGSPVIEVDFAKKFQTIDGFGYSLTGGSAYLINQKLDAPKRDALLKELFLRDENGIGISYLRISVGASDLDDHVFTYHDKPLSQNAASLASFDLAEDRKNLIPVLKQIVLLNPSIKIMGSPWTAPAWMKTNNHAKGGSLKPEFYNAYANYLVKYISGMAVEGIMLDAITLQNEPENPKNTPSMVMTAEEQAMFVKKYLGPAFQVAKLKTKIVVYDHNCDHPEYPIAILNDKEAKKYTDGSAFHMYLGNIEAMSQVHDAHPDKNVYFTEQWTSGEGDFAGDLRWHVKHLIVGASRNWSRNVLEWNLAADPQFNPHTDDGGCTSCQGALTIGDKVTRNVSYYIIAHASKFVPPGSVRVGSNIVDNLYNVAFVTPSNKKVLIVVNDNSMAKEFAIKNSRNIINTSLQAGAVGTFIW